MPCLRQTDAFWASLRALQPRSSNGGVPWGQRTPDPDALGKVRSIEEGIPALGDWADVE